MTALTMVPLTMTWMIAASAFSWLVLVVLTGGAFAAEMTAGLAGPLFVVVVNLALASRVPPASARMQAILLVGFVVRLVFFALYTVLMIRGLGLKPVPFAASFAGYVVALYAMQVLLLRRLVLNRAGAVA